MTLEQEVNDAMNDRIRGEFIEIALRRNLLIWKVHWADALNWVRMLVEWKEDFTMVDLRNHSVVFDYRKLDTGELERIVEWMQNNARCAAEAHPKTGVVQL